MLGPWNYYFLSCDPFPLPSRNLSSRCFKTMISLHKCLLDECMKLLDKSLSDHGIHIILSPRPRICFASSLIPGAPYKNLKQHKKKSRNFHSPWVKSRKPFSSPNGANHKHILAFVLILVTTQTQSLTTLFHIGGDVSMKAYETLNDTELKNKNPAQQGPPNSYFGSSWDVPAFCAQVAIPSQDAP